MLCAMTSFRCVQEYVHTNRLLENELTVVIISHLISNCAWFLYLASTRVRAYEQISQKWAQ